MPNLLEEWAAEKGVSLDVASAPKPKKNTGLGGWLSSLISEGGGLAGAGTGAAIGSAILPGLGTIAGAGIGGLLGGFGGSAIEQQVRDEKVDWGKAGREGLIEGVFSAGPIKLGKAALGAGKAIKAGTGIAEGAAKQVSKSMLGSASRSASKSATIAPTSTLGRASDQNRLLDIVSKDADLAGSGAKKFQAVEGAIGKRVDNVDVHLKGQRKTIAKSDFDSRLEEVGGILEGSERKKFDLIYGRIWRKAFGKKPVEQLTAFDINQLKRQLNKGLSPTYKKLERGATLTDAEEAMLLIRETLDESMESLIPKNIADRVRSINGEISTLIDAIPEFKKLSEQSLGGGLIGKLPATKGLTRAMQASADRAGRVGTKVSDLFSPDNVGARAIPSAVPGALIGAGINTTNNAIDTAQNGQASDLGELEAGFETPFTGGTDMASSLEQSVSSSPFSKSAIQDLIMQDIQQSGGKNVDKLIKLYETFGEEEGGGMELNNTAIQAITDLEAGLNNLDHLSSEIGKSGGNIPFLGSILSKVPNSESKRLRADLDLVKQIIGKALEGGVLRKEDEEKYKRILPTIDDTDADAMQKIDFIRENLQFKLQQFIANQQQFGGGAEAPAYPTTASGSVY